MLQGHQGHSLTFRLWRGAAIVATVAALGFAVLRPDLTAPGKAYALSVPSEQLAGPCDGMPKLDAATLAWLFAPAGDPGVSVTGAAGAKGEAAGSPVAVLDAQTFTVNAPGGGTYTAKLDSDGKTATVTGPDAASAALLERHVNLCLGAVTATAQDAPGVWAGGLYVPMAAGAAVASED